MPIGRLHILTDIHLQQQFSHVELARLACAGGADVIQFRQKEGTIRERLAMLLDVAAVCKASGVQLIVDDHLDLALAVGADGVHLGQDDLPVETARFIVDHHDGPTHLIGATCTTTEQARHAANAGADYLGFGPLFPTTSKTNPASVKGLEGLAEVCSAVSIPIIAIGGITVERVRPVLETGAHGVAVMSAVVSAGQPERAAARFREEIDGCS
ncbi:MAG: thiamine phosphate synthase [Bacteroidetes bacterium]|nr:thiamine phosphate synthase [Bacteroidota bacterium]